MWIKLSNRKQIIFHIEFGFMGMVFPIVKFNDKCFEDYKYIVSKALLAGPLVNVVILIISIIARVIGYEFFTASILINAIMLLSSFSDYMGVQGDVRAYNSMKSNNMYVAQILYNYYMQFSNPYDDNTKNVLISIIEKELNYLKSNVNIYNSSDTYKRAYIYVIEEELKYCIKKYSLEDVADISDNYLKDIMLPIDILITLRTAEYHLKMYILSKDIRYKKSAHHLLDVCCEKHSQNYIYKECIWIIEGGKPPISKIEKMYNNIRYNNYYNEELRIINSFEKLICKGEIINGRDINTAIKNNKT